MSWKPEVQVDGGWRGNALVFATEAEAADYARDLHSRWTLTTGHRAVEVDAAVTYAWIDGRLEAVKTRWIKRPGPGQFRGEGRWWRIEAAGCSDTDWEWNRDTGYLPTWEGEGSPADEWNLNEW